MVEAMEVQKGFKKTEVGIIPDDWNDFDITQLIEKANGIKIGPFGSQLKKELLTNAGFRVYGQENVYEKDMEVGNRFISREHFKQLNSCELKAGDFIISMMGTIGKCMIVPAKFEAGIMDSHLIRLRLDDNKINAELLLHFFTSNILINQVKKLSVGGIMDGLSSKIVKNISVPLPPTKAEQTAIAEALNDADALISELEKLIAKKKAIKQGAMQELLKPKEGWVEKSFTEICDLVHGHQFLTSDFIKSKDGIKIIRISNVQDGKFNLTDCDCISKERLNIFSQYLLNEGDILMSLTGNIGRVVVLPKLNEPLLQNYRVGKFVPKDVDKLFLAYGLASQNTTKQLAINSNQTSQANFGKQDFKKIKIFIPLNNEIQSYIANILKDIDAEIEALEKKLDKYKMLKQGMMQNLLTGKIRLV